MKQQNEKKRKKLGERPPKESFKKKNKKNKNRKKNIPLQSQIQNVIDKYILCE